MNGLDLFSGIGGITYALRSHVVPIAYCENDRHAQGVLLSRMFSGELPQAPIWDDVRTLWGSGLPEVDIIYGGFPCQDISSAGRGAGLEGSRSGLYWELHRLVSETKPSFVFLENVPAIRTRGLDTVVRSLASIGYDCRWTLVSAAEVGAPHLRRRWFLLAKNRDAEAVLGSSIERNESHGDHERSQALANTKSVCKREQTNEANSISVGGEARDESGDSGADVANAAGAGPIRGEPGHGASKDVEEEIRREIDGRSFGTEWPGWWTTEPSVGRVAHGVPARVDRLRGLGNAVVPLQARTAFERLMGL